MMSLKEKKNGKNDNKCCSSHTKYADVFKSETKFRIYGLLSMYKELSLAEIATKLGKSKSTVHDHISKMLDWGVIKVSREERARSNIKRHYYVLDENMDDSGIVKSDVDKETPLDIVIRKKIEVFLSFIEVNMNILKSWEDYFKLMENQLDKGKIDEADAMLNRFKQKIKMISATFLTEEEAKMFHDKYFAVLQEMEEKRGGIKEPGKVEKSYFNGMYILPFRLIMDELHPVKKKS